MSKIDDAYAFYCKHIYDEEKIRLLKMHNLKIAGSVHSVMWELFGAILTGRSGAGTTGADLKGWEVKSAKIRGSFEYQYHLNTGTEKLKDDCLVKHLFCTYSETYKNVVVRIIPGSQLAETFFDKWAPSYLSNYDATLPASERRQRFRKNVSFNFVETHAKLILKIDNGIITERHDDLLEKYDGELP